MAPYIESIAARRERMTDTIETTDWLPKMTTNPAQTTTGLHTTASSHQSIDAPATAGNAALAGGEVEAVQGSPPPMSVRERVAWIESLKMSKPVQPIDPAAVKGRRPFMGTRIASTGAPTAVSRSFVKPVATASEPKEAPMVATDRPVVESSLLSQEALTASTEPPMISRATSLRPIESPTAPTASLVASGEDAVGPGSIKYPNDASSRSNDTPAILSTAPATSTAASTVPAQNSRIPQLDASAESCKAPPISLDSSSIPSSTFIPSTATAVPQAHPLSKQDIIDQVPSTKPDPPQLNHPTGIPPYADPSAPSPYETSGGPPPMAPFEFTSDPMEDIVTYTESSGAPSAAPEPSPFLPGPSSIPTPAPTLTLASSAAAPHPTAPSPLLLIPTELRLLIYRTFFRTTPITLHTTTQSAHAGSHAPTALLRSCRQIYVEAQAVFRAYGRYRYYIPRVQSGQLSDSLATFLRTVKRLEVVVCPWVPRDVRTVRCKNARASWESKCRADRQADIGRLVQTLGQGGCLRALLVRVQAPQVALLEPVLDQLAVGLGGRVRVARIAGVSQPFGSYLEGVLEGRGKGLVRRDGQGRFLMDMEEMEVGRPREGRRGDEWMESGEEEDEGGEGTEMVVEIGRGV